MVVASMRIDPAPGLVLQGRLHLVRGGCGNGPSQLERPVIGDHHPILVAVLDADRPAVEMIAVGLEDLSLGPVLGDRLDRQHDPVLPLFHGNADLGCLAGPELPGDEPPSLRRLVFAHETVWKDDVEMKCP